MKPLRYFLQCTAVSMFPALLAFTCTEDAGLTAGGTTETSSGRVVGTIWNGDGTGAKGVSVRLTPVEYNPLAGNGQGAVIATTTDEHGKYAFVVKSSGFFTILANDEKSYCYSDSVQGSADGENRAHDDTLKPPGAIAGVARLESGSGEGVFVLALGTDTYAAADSATGSFMIPTLARGDYRLRIITTNKSYGSLDTTVSVKSGDTAVIPGVFELRYQGVPKVTSVFAEYDSATMRVRLFWPKIDTSNLAAYYVFRTTEAIGGPCAIVGKNDTSYTDDLVLLEPDSLPYRDTIRYCVAALGTDRTLGVSCQAPDILMRNSFTPEDTIELPITVPRYFADMYVDNSRSIYLGGYDWLGKIDSLHRIDASHSFNNEDCMKIVTDDKNNAYVLTNTRGDTSELALIKFTPDLKSAIRKPVAEISRAWSNVQIISNNKGSMFVVGNDSGAATLIDRFDSTLSTGGSSTIGELLGYPSMCGDTVYFQEMPDIFDGITAQPYSVKKYDKHGTQIGTRDFSAKVKAFCPSGYFGQTFRFDISDRGVSMLGINGQNSSGSSDIMVLAVGPDNSILGRFCIGSTVYAIGGGNRLYVYREAAHKIYVFRLCQ